MASWAEVHKPQFIVSTGDNFYPSGVRSTDDPQWNNKWVEVYNNDSIKDLPWYISVGNHDYGNGRGMCAVWFALIETILYLFTATETYYHIIFSYRIYYNNIYNYNNITIIITYNYNVIAIIIKILL